MPQILVTGATGTFGSAVTHIFERLHVPFRALVRDPSRFSGHATEVAVGDFGDPESLDAGLSGISKLFLASFGGKAMPALQRNVIAAARRQGVKHVVRISTIGVDDPRLASVMAKHIEGEQDLERSGLLYTHLRPSWVLQNFLPTSRTSPVRRRAIRLPGGSGRVGFVDARDVAAVACCALTEPGHEGRAYTLTGPKARSHSELATSLSQYTGLPIRYEDIPPEAYRKDLERAGWPPESIAAMNLLYEGIRAGRSAQVTDDIERVTRRRALSIDDFARDHAAVFSGSP